MRDVNGFKIFKVNEIDWVAASSLEEAVAHAQELTLTQDEGFEPFEISDEEADRLVMHPEDDGDNAPRTFREELQRNVEDELEFPILFGSSEI
jgi:hypothetical protein